MSRSNAVTDALEPSSTAAPSASESWDRFCDSLRAFGRVALEKSASLDQAEGLRHTMRFLGHLAEMHLERNDPVRPEFFRALGPIRKFWGDGVDVDYDVAVISSAHEYRISGNRGTVPYLAILVNRMGNSADRVAANVLVTPDRCDADGSFELYLSEDLGDRPGITLDARCADVVVRQYHKNRDDEVDAVFEIERLGEPAEPRTPISTELLSARFKHLARSLDVSIQRLTSWMTALSSRPNELVANSAHGESAFFGTTSNQYIFGWFDLSDADSISFTMDPPECIYLGIDLYNPWFESLEYRDHVVNLNDSHLKRDADGRITVRIGGAPAEENWLDTRGHTHGVIVIRILEPVGDVDVPAVVVNWKG